MLRRQPYITTIDDSNIFVMMGSNTIYFNLFLYIYRLTYHIISHLPTMTGDAVFRWRYLNKPTSCSICGTIGDPMDRFYSYDRAQDSSERKAVHHSNICRSCYTILDIQARGRGYHVVDLDPEDSAPIAPVVTFFKYMTPLSRADQVPCTTCSDYIVGNAYKYNRDNIHKHDMICHECVANLRRSAMTSNYTILDKTIDSLPKPRKRRYRVDEHTSWFYVVCSRCLAHTYRCIYYDFIDTSGKGKNHMYICELCKIELFCNQHNE